MTEQKIYYKKVRDLGAIFGATFGYIKKNFKPLYGSLLFFAGPVLMIAAALSTFMMGSSLGMANLFKGGYSSFYGNFILSYITAMMIMFIGITVYNVIINRNLIENEKLNQDEALTVKHSTINFWPDFWKLLGNSLLLVLISILTFAVFGFAFAGIIALSSNGNDSAAIILTVISVILIFVFLLICGPVLAFVPLAAIFVSQRDELNIFPSIKKVLYYMKGNFWNTWIVSLVGLLTYSVLGAIVQIPTMIVTMFTTFSRYNTTVGYGIDDPSTPIMLVVVTAISSLISYGVMVIYHLIAVYQFTSLEEKKEGVSILEKINQIQ